MKSIRVIPAIAFAALLITSCVTMQKPVFKNTLWRGESQMFVADAGILTETYTLEFTSDKQCLWKDAWVLPAHPATYIKEDGSIDMIPESGNETLQEARWQYKRGQLTLTFEDGSSKSFAYKDGHLCCPSFNPGEELVLKKQ